MSFFLMIWALSALGFLSLSMTMDKHQKQYFSKVLDPKTTQLATWAGWAILALTLLLAIGHYHIANGISYWIGALSFSALFILAMLSYFAEHFKSVSISLVIILVLSSIIFYV